MKQSQITRKHTHADNTEENYNLIKKKKNKNKEVEEEALDGAIRLAAAVERTQCLT